MLDCNAKLELPLVVSPDGQRVNVSILHPETKLEMGLARLLKAPTRGGS